MARGWPHSRLKRVLLPTLGRPTMARIGRLLTFDLGVLDRRDRIVAQLSELTGGVLPLVGDAHEQLEMHLLLYQGFDSLACGNPDGLDLCPGFAHDDLTLTHLFYVNRGRNAQERLGLV